MTSQPLGFNMLTLYHYQWPSGCRKISFSHLTSALDYLLSVRIQYNKSLRQACPPSIISTQDFSQQTRCFRTISNLSSPRQPKAAHGTRCLFTVSPLPSISIQWPSTKPHCYNQLSNLTRQAIRGETWTTRAECTSTLSSVSFRKHTASTD